MGADSQNVCMVIADPLRQQWLYALLSRYYQVQTGLPAHDAQTDIDLYLFDEPALSQELARVQGWRDNIQPDSPSVLLICDKNKESVPAQLQGLVDEIMPADSDGERMREHINQWLHLRSSALSWVQSSQSKTKKVTVNGHPTTGLQCPVAPSIEYSLGKSIDLPDQIKSQLMSLLFETSSQGMFICNAAGCLITANPAFAAIVGYELAELEGAAPDFLLPKRGQGDYFGAFFQYVFEQKGWDGELSGRRKDGDIFPLWLTMRFLPDIQDGETVNSGFSIGIITDLSVNRMLEDSVLQLSRTDSLSELNRVLLEERLSLELRYAERHQQQVAVFYINLRRFRLINDRFGYAVGDWVLMEQLQRLRNLVGNQGFACRLFANNYVVVMSRLDDLVPAQKLAEDIRQQLGQPLLYDSKEVLCHPVIGFSAYPQHGVSSAELIRNADIAMDWCRRDMTCQIQLFSYSQQTNVQQKLNLERELRQALLNNEFFLEYQPQIHVETGVVHSVEALIRWNSPRGRVGPKDFIPFAEECDLIAPISLWVLQEACRQGAEWLMKGINLTIAVNLSAMHFQTDVLVEQVARTLKESGFPANRLELEVTESCIMADVNSSISTLHALKKLGVSLSVDDFGTGYSSLSYLKLFPLDKLKIDQSFVRDLADSNSDAVIVRAIVALGHAMGLTVIAEGVETEHQEALLRSWHCDELQGYRFARPCGASELPAVVVELSRNSSHVDLKKKENEQRILLLVDDEPSIINALRRTLRSNDYKIITANSAAEALDQLAHHDVDVIVSDNRMPMVSGLELLRQVKQRYPNVIRIMLSGYSDFNSLSTAVNSGEIFRFLSKPWEDAQLKDAVREGFMRADSQRLVSIVSHQEPL